MKWWAQNFLLPASPPASAPQPYPHPLSSNFPVTDLHGENVGMGFFTNTVLCHCGAYCWICKQGSGARGGPGTGPPLFPLACESPLDGHHGHPAFGWLSEGRSPVHCSSFVLDSAWLWSRAQSPPLPPPPCPVSQQQQQQQQQLSTHTTLHVKQSVIPGIYPAKQCP